MKQIIYNLILICLLLTACVQENSSQDNVLIKPEVTKKPKKMTIDHYSPYEKFIKKFKIVGLPYEVSSKHRIMELIKDSSFDSFDSTDLKLYIKQLDTIDREKEQATFTQAMILNHPIKQAVKPLYRFIIDNNQFDLMIFAVYGKAGHSVHSPETYIIYLCSYNKNGSVLSCLPLALRNTFTSSLNDQTIEGSDDLIFSGSIQKNLHVMRQSFDGDKSQYEITSDGLIVER